eukprot:m.9299 g.9299  ORF g.9299 m.9299 type:complete len:569 (-) comp2957_c0_seq1:171-1877(-)
MALVLWEWRAKGDRWYGYPQPIEAVIEAAYAKYIARGGGAGAAAQFRLPSALQYKPDQKHGPLEIDLVQRTQRNLDTGKIRAIERTGAGEWRVVLDRRQRAGFSPEESRRIEEARQQGQQKLILAPLYYEACDPVMLDDIVIDFKTMQQNRRPVRRRVLRGRAWELETEAGQWLRLSSSICMVLSDAQASGDASPKAPPFAELFVAHEQAAIEFDLRHMKVTFPHMRESRTITQGPRTWMFQSCKPYGQSRPFSATISRFLTESHKKLQAGAALVRVTLPLSVYLRKRAFFEFDLDAQVQRNPFTNKTLKIREAPNPAPARAVPEPEEDLLDSNPHFNFLRDPRAKLEPTNVRMLAMACVAHFITWKTPGRIYGGFVRDWLINNEEANDIDVALPNRRDVAKFSRDLVDFARNTLRLECPDSPTEKGKAQAFKLCFPAAPGRLRPKAFDVDVTVKGEIVAGPPGVDCSAGNLAIAPRAKLEKKVELAGGRHITLQHCIRHCQDHKFVFFYRFEDDRDMCTYCVKKLLGRQWTCLNRLPDQLMSALTTQERCLVVPQQQFCRNWWEPDP